jgi:hypothetical protein
MLLLSLFASALLILGLCNLLLGGGPALERTMVLDPHGARLQGEFRVRQSCTQEFDLRLIHRQGYMGEFDGLVVNKELPLTVTVDIYRKEGEDSVHLAHLGGQPRLAGRGGEPHHIQHR